MTNCTKDIWIIVIVSSTSTITHRVAAWNFIEAISFINDESKKFITEVRKTAEQVTYQY